MIFLERALGEGFFQPRGHDLDIATEVKTLPGAAKGSTYAEAASPAPLCIHNWLQICLPGSMASRPVDKEGELAVRWLVFLLGEVFFCDLFSSAARVARPSSSISEGRLEKREGSMTKGRCGSDLGPVRPLICARDPQLNYPTLAHYEPPKKRQHSESSCLRRL